MTLALGLTCGFCLQQGGIETFSWIFDNWVPLLSASLAMSGVQATWVWGYSFFSRELLALGGNSGNIVYDVRACVALSLGSVPVAARIELIVVVPWSPTQPDLAGFPQLRPQDLQRGPPGYYRLGAAQHRLRVRAVPPQRPSHGQHDPCSALPGMVLTRLALGGGTLSYVPRPMILTRSRRS